ncbi:MAG: right-handed parallel beta-helix repeat-containing protein [Nitrospirota bacterium]
MRVLWKGHTINIVSLCLVLTLGCAPVRHTAEDEGHVQTVFYVAPFSMGGSDNSFGTSNEPFLTLERAKQAVGSVNKNMTGDIVVYLREGTYELKEPVVFQAHDSGQQGYRVTYMAYPGEHPVVTGGQRILGWVHAGNGVFKANTHGLQFRQLYVNGQPRVRARTPNEGSFNRLHRWDTSDRTIVVASSEIPNLSEVHGVEMVIHKEWTQNNLRLASVSLTGSEAYVIPLEPDRTKAFRSHDYLRKNGQSYYLENAFEFLDAEGEWYLRAASNEVYYKPRAEEDASTMVAIAPKLPQLLRFQGTPNAPVENIHFRGIVFEHSTWLAPSEEGFATNQADSIFKGTKQTYQIPGAIHVQNAENIRFEGNVFRNIGATAVVLWSGVRDNAFVGNTFQNISASGISIGMDLEKQPIDPSQVCRDNVIKNNLITKVGRDYHSSVGIFAGYTEGLVIENNELADMPYTGISVGWGWTFNETPLRNNLIKRNRIHHVMNLLADGAGIYTLSRQPGTRIVENYIFNIARSPWAGDFPISGMYLDEGSSLIELTNNLLEQVPIGIDFHRAEYNTVTNNMASYQERNASRNNDFVRIDDFDVAAIKANAGIDRMYAPVVLTAPLQP